MASDNIVLSFSSSTTGGQQALIINPATAGSSGAMTALQVQQLNQLSNKATAPVNIFVNGVTGNDSGNGKINNPVKTFDAAWALIPPGSSGLVTLNFLNPTTSLLSYALNREAYSFGNTANFDQPRLQIVGARMDSKNPQTNVNMGTMTIGSVIDNDHFTASCGLTPASDGFFRGKRFLNTSKGWEMIITDNVTVAGVTTFSTLMFFFSPNGPGDLFIIDQPSIALALSQNTTFNALTGAGFRMSDFDIVGSGNGIITSGAGDVNRGYEFARCRLFDVFLRTGANTGATELPGMYCSGGQCSPLGVGSAAFLNWLVADNSYQVNCADNAFFFSISMDLLQANVRLDSNAQSTLVIGKILNSPQYGILCNNNSALSIYGGIDISGSATDGLLVGDRSFVRVSGCTGANNVLAGINVYDMSQCEIDLFSNPTNILGLVTPLQIGASAQPYAAVRPDGYSEINAGGPTLNRIQPASPIAQ